MARNDWKRLEFKPNLNQKRSQGFQIFIFFNVCILNGQCLPKFALHFVSMRWSKCFFNNAGWAEANQQFPWGRCWGKGIWQCLRTFRPVTEKAVSCRLKYQMQIPSWQQLSRLPWSWWICDVFKQRALKLLLWTLMTEPWHDCPETEECRRYLLESSGQSKGKGFAESSVKPHLEYSTATWTTTFKKN